MSKKPHSGLKRALAWMLTVAMMAQGCIVYADDFTSEPDAAVVEEAAVLKTLTQVQTATWNLLMKEKIHQQKQMFRRSVMRTSTQR